MNHNESNAPKNRRSLLRIVTAVTYILAMLFIGVSAQAQAASQAKKSATDHCPGTWRLGRQRRLERGYLSSPGGWVYSVGGA